MESIIKAIKEQKQFYKNKDGSFKEDTEGNKISKPPLKDSTLKTYSANFKKIAGDNSLTDLSWLKDIDNIKEKLKDLSDNTKKNYYNVITVVLQATGKEPEILPKYIALRDSLNKEYEKQNETGIISDKQAPNFVTKEVFDNMVNTINQQVKLLNLKTKDKTNKEEKNLFQLLIILKFYQIYPLRNELATIKKISEKDFKELPENDKGNYLIIKDDGRQMKLSLADFKTADSYGTNQLPVGVVLKRLLNTWFTKFNPNNDNVFVQTNGEQLTKNNLTKMLTRASMKYMDGKKISTTMIRKIYTSDLFAEKNQKQKKVAKVMGHSVDTQNKVYVKKPQEDNVPNPV